jgi:hypothetical protein
MSEHFNEELHQFESLYLSQMRKFGQQAIA